MENKTKDNELLFKVSVELKEFPKEQKWPEMAAYLFSRSGRLIDKKLLLEDENQASLAQFEIKSQYEGLIVKIGPEIKDLKDIQRLKKYQPIVKRVELKEDKILKIDILKPFWICWLKIPYHVTGSVMKQKPGDDAPICVGEVDIYDVDIRYCILRLPDIVIEQIRDSIIDLIVDPPPIEIEKIPPHLIQWDDDDYCGTGPRPFPPPKNIIEKLETLPREWSFAKSRFETLGTARGRMDAILKAMPLAQKREFLNTEAVETVNVSQIIYSNTVQFQNLLVEKFQAFRFWLCWYPWIYWLWWPYCGYSLEKLGTAELQPDGSFSDTVWLSVCRNDTPDLWFVVKQEINGIERVIYARHPVPCNTFWNHPDGKPVKLIVIDSKAVACHQPGPGIAEAYIMPMGIYEDEWYEVDNAHIKALCIPANPLPAACGLYNGTDPYGTRLDIRMQLHDDLRTLLPLNNGVRYYRWSYRKHGTTAWTHIDTPIIHRYLTKIAPGKYVIDSEKLGPNSPVGTENNLFMIPDPNKSWLDNRNDLAFAIWHTAIWDGNKYVPQIQDGKYDLKLEVFDKNGNNLNPAGAGFKYILPTSATGPVDDALFVEPDGSLILHIHIDNKDTISSIESVALNGSKAGDCQFLEYQNKFSDIVGIEYAAYHPTSTHNFMSHYNLTIKRGISGSSLPAPVSIFNSTPAMPWTIHSIDVDDLLGSYEQCAFGVWLHTYPRTRDGHSRIRAYESSDMSAFAIVKKVS